MSDSLILANAVELLGGGVASVNPLCAGAVYRLQPGFDLGAPQPTTDFVASLILDGERPFGRRASNRTIKLPIWITAPDRRTLAAAREVLEQAIDQDVWTMTWVRDPGPGGTPLPLIIDCFRAQATVPTYQTLLEKELTGLQVELTIPALPYGRADVQTQVSFAAPVPTTPPPPPPPVPVVLDAFAQISSPQCSQSTQCVVGPYACCWDPGRRADRRPGRAADPADLRGHVRHPAEPVEHGQPADVAGVRLAVLRVPGVPRQDPRGAGLRHAHRHVRAHAVVLAGRT